MNNQLTAGKKTGTIPILSQVCLPGGPRSATYNSSTYEYLSPNTLGNQDILQPSILAIDGDTQVGGNLYNSESNDPNYNRGPYPSIHTVTEKAFYTELSPKSTGSFGLQGPVYNTQKGQTFLRVDLTEGGSVFRHNAVIVKGSVHCTTQTRRYTGQDMLNGEAKVWGLYDFEYYFVCHPLHSNFQPDGISNSEYELLKRLQTVNNCYFYVRNRSWGDDEISDAAQGASAAIGVTIKNPILTNNSSLQPNQNWAEFALASETGTNLDGLNVVSHIHRPKPGADSDLKYVTPFEANLTNDPNEKWDLNHVNFKFSLPYRHGAFLSTAQIEAGYTSLEEVPENFDRFAVKGTYLLI